MKISCEGLYVPILFEKETNNGGIKITGPKNLLNHIIVDGENISCKLNVKIFMIKGKSIYVNGEFIATIEGKEDIVKIAIPEKSHKKLDKSYYILNIIYILLFYILHTYMGNRTPDKSEFLETAEKAVKLGNEAEDIFATIIALQSYADDKDFPNEAFLGMITFNEKYQKDVIKMKELADKFDQMSTEKESQQNSLDTEELGTVKVKMLGEGKLRIDFEKGHIVTNNSGIETAKIGVIQMSNISGSKLKINGYILSVDEKTISFGYKELKLKIDKSNGKITKEDDKPITENTEELTFHNKDNKKEKKTINPEKTSKNVTQISDLINNLPDGEFKELVMNYISNIKSISDKDKVNVQEQFEDYLESKDPQWLKSAINGALNRVNITVKRTGNNNELNVTGSGKTAFNNVKTKNIDINNYNRPNTMGKNKEINIGGTDNNESVKEMVNGEINIGGTDNTLTIEYLEGILSGNLGGINNKIIIKSKGPNAEIKINKGGMDNQIIDKSGAQNTSSNHEFDNYTTTYKKKKVEKSPKRSSERSVNMNGITIDMSKEISGEKIDKTELGSLGVIKTYKTQEGIIVSFTKDQKESRFIMGKNMTIGFIDSNQITQGSGFGSTSNNTYKLDGKDLKISSDYTRTKLTYEGKTISISKSSGKMETL